MLQIELFPNMAAGNELKGAVLFVGISKRRPAANIMVARFGAEKGRIAMDVLLRSALKLQRLIKYRASR